MCVGEFATYVPVHPQNMLRERARARESEFSAQLFIRILLLFDQTGAHSTRTCRGKGEEVRDSGRERREGEGGRVREKGEK